MKKILILSVICLLSIHALAQQKTTISGKLLNCKDRVLMLIPNTGYFTDSIVVNSDGSFHYTTTTIKEPFRANLTNRKQIQIQLFIGPGYDLQITADVKDYKTVGSTLTYQGLGGKTNAYWTKMVANYKPETVKWIEKDENTYISYLKRSGNYTDVMDAVFTSNNTEPYANYFKESLILDKKFGDYLSIFESYAYQHAYKWPQIQKMITKLGYKPLSEEFKNEKNLAGANFSFLLGQYPLYCNTYNAFPASNEIKGMRAYTLFIADKFYTGSIYDYAVYNKISSSLPSVSKLDDFKKLEIYIQKIRDTTLKNRLNALMVERMKKAILLQTGSPSPLFNLADTSGRFHQLTAMKGKVVYIDLWASWCGPCKAETPFLKKIYDQLKSNDKIQIISIASFDAKNRKERYKIIKEDNMDWLQLEDTNDSFAKSYFANSIPRFIIIDKKGNIVDNDALRPSQSEKLMEVLMREIGK